MEATVTFLCWNRFILASPDSHGLFYSFATFKTIDKDQKKNSPVGIDILPRTM